MKIELDSQNGDMPFIVALLEIINSAKQKVDAKPELKKVEVKAEPKEEKPKPKPKAKPKTKAKPKVEPKPEPVDEEKQPTQAEFSAAVQAHKAKFDINRTKEILIATTGENHPATVDSALYTKAIDALEKDKGPKAEKVDQLIGEEF